MVSDNLSRVHRILEKLEQVRSRGLSCFGSEKHGFRLNPALTEAELEAFEKKHNIQLPGDYRAFLRHAGNGGAGPYYGLLRLEEWDGFLGWLTDDYRVDFLSQPCPLYPDLVRKEEWRDQFADVCPYQGTLSLAHEGCSYVVQLVVTGRHAGRVVRVDAEGQPPLMVPEADFLSWYESWVNYVIGGEGLGFSQSPKRALQNASKRPFFSWWAWIILIVALGIFLAESLRTNIGLPGIGDKPATGHKK
jgi:hypothetical protein